MTTPEDVARSILLFRSENEHADYTIGHMLFADGNLSGYLVRYMLSDENYKIWFNSADTFTSIDDYFRLTVKVSDFLINLLQYDEDFLADVGDLLSDWEMELNE